MGLFRALIIVSFVAVIPVALITTNIRVAVSERHLYDYSVRKHDASEASGIPQSELLRANGEIKDYLTNKNADELEPTVWNDRGSSAPLFNSRETMHMADVRNLVQILFDAQAASTLLLLTLAVMIIVIWPVKVLATTALCGAILTGLVLGMVGIVAASGFDSAWTELHRVAFNNDFWQLDPSRDRLIQMFPEAFWQEITALLVIATLLEAVLIGGASAAYLVMSSRPEYVPLGALAAPEVTSTTGHSRTKLAAPKARHYFR